MNNLEMMQIQEMAYPGSSVAERHFASSLVSGLKAASATRADKWVLRYRIMGNPFPGPKTFKYHPWQREMLLCPAREVTGQKAAQMGYSDLMLDKAMHTNDIRKQDVLYVLPSKTPDAMDFSAGRFNPALEMSPYLRNLYKDSNSVSFKSTGTNVLYVVGSRSRGALTSRPVALIILDETDQMSEEAIALGRARSDGQVAGTFQFWKVSTPTVPNHGINKEWFRSSQAEFFFPCPSCSRNINLNHDNLVICGEHENDPDITRSHMICRECKAVLPQQGKTTYIPKGTFVHAYPERAEYHSGFYVNQCYSAVRGPVDLARDFLRGLTSVAEEQEYFNSKMGMPHIVNGAEIKLSDVDLCIEGYRENDPKFMTPIITIGIDVGKYLHVTVKHWRRYADSNTNDINESCMCFHVASLKYDEFEELDEAMYFYKPAKVVIDHQPETRKAAAFARRFPGLVYLCHYGNDVSRREIVIHEDPQGASMVTVDRTSWLDLSLGRVKKRRLTLPTNTPLEYRQHKSSLVRLLKLDKLNNPVASYVNTGPDHFAHADNYAEIALTLSAQHGSSLNITTRTH